MIRCIWARTVSRWRKNRIPSVDPFTSVPSITRTTLLFIHTYTCNRLISSQALYLLIKQKYYQLNVAFPLKFQAKNLMLENEHQMLTLVLSPLVLVVPPKTIPAPWGELPVATRKNTKACNILIAHLSLSFCFEWQTELQKA